MKEFEIEVIERIVETHDCVSLVLRPVVPVDIVYKAGQFLTIDPHRVEDLSDWVHFFEDQKGKKEPPRAYSLTSAPIEPQLVITIKEERYVSGVTQYPPLLSPWLCRFAKVGSRFPVKGFSGPYTLPDDLCDVKDVVHVCAGSGIVPSYSIIKESLLKNWALTHTLIYGNKTFEDIIYRDALVELERQHQGKLRIVHALSREANISRCGANVVAGRVTQQMIASHIRQLEETLFFTCGPGISKWDRRAAHARGEEASPRFLECVLDALRALGVDPSRIKHESYG